MGLLLALVARNLRGKGTVADPDAGGEELEILWSAEDVRRVGDLPPVLERLMSLDSSERLAALVMLSSSPDAAAMSVLHWAIEHGPPEVVLDVALTLDELDRKRERQLVDAGASLGGRAARAALPERPPRPLLPSARSGAKNGSSLAYPTRQWKVESETNRSVF